MPSLPRRISKPHRLSSADLRPGGPSVGAEHDHAQAEQSAGAPSTTGKADRRRSAEGHGSHTRAGDALDGEQGLQGLQGSQGSQARVAPGTPLSPREKERREEAADPRHQVTGWAHRPLGQVATLPPEARGGHGSPWAPLPQRLHRSRPRAAPGRPRLREFHRASDPKAWASWRVRERRRGFPGLAAKDAMGQLNALRPREWAFGFKGLGGKRESGAEEAGQPTPRGDSDCAGWCGAGSWSRCTGACSLGWREVGEAPSVPSGGPGLQLVSSGSRLFKKKRKENSEVLQQLPPCQPREEHSGHLGGFSRLPMALAWSVPEHMSPSCHEPGSPTRPGHCPVTKSPVVCQRPK